MISYVSTKQRMIRNKISNDHILCRLKKVLEMVQNFTSRSQISGNWKSLDVMPEIKKKNRRRQMRRAMVPEFHILCTSYKGSQAKIFPISTMLSENFTIFK